MTMLAAAPSYADLYAEHGPAARRLALTLVPEHAAEDVVQTAFTKVMDTTGRLGPPVSFRPYFLAAVRNCARSWHAGAGRLVPVGVPELPESVPGPDTITIEREDARLAAAAFATLPRRWRSVLWATAVEERPAGEIAEQWDMVPNAVSQLASRAREGLRQAYLTAHLRNDLAGPCHAVAPYMGAAVRGKAGRRHQRELLAHLGCCTRCRQTYEGLGALNHHLGALLVPGVAAGLYEAVRAAARPGARALHLSLPAAAAGTVAAAAGSLVLVLPAHVHQPAVVLPQAVVPPFSASAPAIARHIPRHVRTVARVAVGPAADAAAVLASPAGSVVASTGADAGQVVTQAGQGVGQVVTGATGAVGGSVGQVGQAASGTVQQVSGTAGQLVTSVTSSAGSLLGGL